MTRRIRLAPLTLLIAALTSSHATAQQQPPQFKASVKMKDGSDGTTSSGTMYFGGAKMRTELTSDGQSVIVLVDPAAKTRYMLMPSEKAYMQMPIGQGPGAMAVAGPSDPMNPCAVGSGNTDCAKGEKETVSGYETIRWDFTSPAGVRTRSWISTKLRFPVKSQDDDGSSMEFSSIAEGPQPASLFAIPAGYQKMDVGMMGDAGRGRGRGRGSANANDPMAAMMANLPAEAQAQMAAALRGGAVEAPKGAVAPTGSSWEKGNGWLVNVTITAGETEGPTAVTKGPGPSRTIRKNYSMKWTGSVPLNFVSAAAGVPGTPGPVWTLLAGQADIGTAAANKIPITLAVASETTIDESWTSDCVFSGIGYIDPGKRHTVATGSAGLNGSVTKLTGVMLAQGNLTLSADLKTYDLVFGIGSALGKEETRSHTETTGCRDKQVHAEDNNSVREPDYSVSLELKAQPLPATVSTISGSKKMPVRLDGRELNANVAWTITPIR